MRLNWNEHVSVNFCWLTEAFAVVREAAKRKLGMRHFDVQVSLFLSVLKKKKVLFYMMATPFCIFFYSDCERLNLVCRFQADYVFILFVIAFQIVDYWRSGSS